MSDLNSMGIKNGLVCLKIYILNIILNNKNKTEQTNNKTPNNNNKLTHMVRSLRNDCGVI